MKELPKIAVATASRIPLAAQLQAKSDPRMQVSVAIDVTRFVTRLQTYRYTQMTGGGSSIHSDDLGPGAHRLRLPLGLALGFFHLHVPWTEIRGTTHDNSLKR